MARVWTPLLCLLPATFLTAAVRTTHTSWKTSSCKIHSGLLRDCFTPAWFLMYGSPKKIFYIKVMIKLISWNKVSLFFSSFCDTPIAILYVAVQSESHLSLFVLSSGMLWAAWSFWWQRITWLFTWTERRLAGRCLASAGWRDATRWLTGSKTDRHNQNNLSNSEGN